MLTVHMRFLRQHKFPLDQAKEKQIGGAEMSGPAVGLELETEPIENWLKIELEASAVRDGSSTTWDLDLQFKKPWRVREHLEITPGIGPTWEHATGPRPRGARSKDAP
jgi:hypothetical protein